MLSRKKRIVFSLVPVTLLLALLVVAEFVVRRASPSTDNQLALETTYDGIEWYQVNRSYLKKYFPAGSPLIPEFKSSLFKRHKNPNVFRIMCLGGSSMFGTPYDMNANIPGIVRKQLRHIYPDREFEVINWGASAINSNVVADLSRQILQYQPDLVLIYMGHNEFYGPDGVGASFLEKSLPFLTPLKYRLRELRLVQLFQSWLRGAVSGEQEGAEANLMREVSAGSLVHSGSSEAERILSMFRGNLGKTIGVFKEGNVPVIVSDVSSNLMFPPFVSDSIPADLRKGIDFTSITNDFTSGKYQEGLANLRDLYQTDSMNAFVNYWTGRSLLGLGRPDEARRYLARARDEDLLKFRAPDEINQIIHQVSAEERVTCISVDSVLSATSSGGIPGDEVFWEHLHPTAYGYYLIANTFVRAIVDLGLIPGGQATLLTGLIPFNPDSLSICWMELAYADRSIQHITGRWPFEDYRRFPVVLQSADVVQLGILDAVYGRQMAWDEGCYRTAAYFWSQRRFRDARTTYEALLEEYPYNFYSNYLLANMLNTTGEGERAVPYYERSILSNPEYPNARLDLALMEINRGKFDEAISRLNKVLQLTVDQGLTLERATAFYGLGTAHANKGDFDKALATIDSALRLVPGYRDALSLRASILGFRRRPLQPSQ